MAVHACALLGFLIGAISQRSDHFLASKSAAAKPSVPTTPWGKLSNVNCYMDEYPYDHGAEVNLNGGAPITVSDADECWQKCQLDAYHPQGDGFTGCEYAVYASGRCWPRRGLQCSKCDGGSSASGFTLLIPPSWPVDCPRRRGLLQLCASTCCGQTARR